MYRKNIDVVKEFLKTASADILAKPATVNMLSNFYLDKTELSRLTNDKPSGAFLVAIANAYMAVNLPKVSPQLICVELRKQANDEVIQKAFANFEDTFDFKKTTVNVGEIIW